MAELNLSGVTKSYAAFNAVSDVSLSIREGEFAVFVGPSGCGKSTLLRLIAGLDPVTGGNISIGGKDVTRRPAGQRPVAMVFQSYALYPHMSVYQNIAFPLQMERKSKAEIDREVRQAAETVQLTTRLDDKPSRLSGGQRQRVAIARAIVRHPGIFLMDEPLSNLDAALRMEMRNEVTQLHRRLGSTMIYVTHDQLEAMTMADRIVVLNGGKVEQVGAPMDLYHNPANTFVAGFIGSPPMNFVSGKVETGGSSQVTVDAERFGRLTLPVRDGGFQAGEQVTLGIRPEMLELGDQAGTARATVTPFNVERLGLHSILHCGEASKPFICLFNGDPRLAAGTGIQVSAPLDHIIVFDSNGRNRSPVVTV